DTDTDTDTDDDIDTNADGSVTYIQRKDINNAITAIDKRQYIRFNIQEIKHPVMMEKSENVSQLLDISRGGIAVKHNNTLKVGDIIPVHITYKDLDITANIKVVSASNTRAGAEFTNLDKAIANQLLYLNVMLEADNNILATRLK
ncbi:MAG: PilZ domain-containing protein, partial [Candidatus Gastranaerophilales bacterium]|nr:PilZ domain-containing protein [Candidatus Gastranaerophilales bacterium]